MIPTIGIMIGCYTFVRLVALAAQPGQKWPVRVLAVLAGLAIALCTIDLLVAGTRPMPTF